MMQSSTHRRIGLVIGLLVAGAAAQAQPPTLVVGTIAGDPAADFVDALGRDARFNGPCGLDVAGDTLYVADSGNHAIRAVALLTGEVTTVAGTGQAGQDDGPIAQATFNNPRDVLYDEELNILFVADTGNHVIRGIFLDTGEVGTIAGTGVPGWNDASGDEAQFDSPSGLCWLYSFGGVGSTDNDRPSEYGAYMVVADTGNNCLRSIAYVGASPGPDRSGAIPATDYDVWTAAGQPTEPPGMDDGPADEAKFNQPTGVAEDYARMGVLVADMGNHALRFYDDYGRQVSTIQGDGTPGTQDSPDGTTLARFNSPTGLILDILGPYGVADTGNHRWRPCDPATKAVTTASGSVAGYLDAILPNALFNTPVEGMGRYGQTDPVGLDRPANPGPIIGCISDYGNNCIRAVGSNNPPSADIGGPYSVDTGDPLLLDGSASDDADVLLGDYVADWAWDLDDDGDFDDASGAMVPLTPFGVWLLFGVHDGSTPTYPYYKNIALQVTDIFGETATQAGSVEVLSELLGPEAPTLHPEPEWTPGAENELAWDPATGATGYELEWARSILLESPVRSIITPDLSAVVTGLKHNVTYVYRVRGIFESAANLPSFPGPWSAPERSTQDARPPQTTIVSSSDPFHSRLKKTRIPWEGMESGSGFKHVVFYYTHDGDPTLKRYPGRSRPSMTRASQEEANQEFAQGAILFDIEKAEGDGVYDLFTVGVDQVGNRERIPWRRDLRLVVDTTPPTISDITVSRIRRDSARISWKTNERTTGKVAYGETTAYGSETPETPPGARHVVTLTGLTRDTEYHFEITARDRLGNESTSGDQTFRTILPTAPVISDIQVTHITWHGASISWKTAKLATCRLVYAAATSDYGSETEVTPLGKTHRVHIDGLTRDTEYHFEITATDRIGETSTSGEQTFRTARTGPLVISDIVVKSITRDSADISWKTDKLTTGGVDYGLTAAYGSWEGSRALAKYHVVHLSGLTPESTYHFEITATHASGEEGKSGDQTFTTRDRIPGAPVLRGEPPYTKGARNRLSWSMGRASVSAVARYVLQWDTSPDFDSSPQDLKTPNTELTVRGLSDATEYFYRVAALNRGSVQGPWSNVESSTQDDSPPETEAQLASAPTAVSRIPQIELTLRSSDATSGVKYVLLFFAKDRGPFRQYGGRISPTTRSILFNLDLGGGHYAFYTIGVDKVGNREAPPGTPDVEVDVRLPTILQYLGDLGTTTGQDALFAARLMDTMDRPIVGEMIPYRMMSVRGMLPPTDRRGFTQATVNVPLAPGTYDLVLEFAGRTTLQGSKAKVVFVVKPEVVPPGPRVDVAGSGAVVDSAGDRYSFDIDVSSNPLGGRVVVRTQGKVLRATTITSVNASGSSATITGICTVNRSGAFRFVIRVTDARTDKFGITTTEGTFVPPTALASGDVSITRRP